MRVSDVCKQLTSLYCFVLDLSTNRQDNFPAPLIIEQSLTLIVNKHNNTDKTYFDSIFGLMQHII